VLLAASAGVSVGHAARPTTTSLAMTFPDPPSDPTVGPFSGLYNDSNGPYVNGADPGHKTPNVYFDSSNLLFDLTGSTRSLCLKFDIAPPFVFSSLPSPINTCFPVQANTLTTADYGGVANLVSGQSQYFSIVIYWTGLGTDNLSHKYSVAFRNRDSHPLWVGRSGDTWTFITQPTPDGNGTDGIGRVSVYLSGKGGGWNDVGDYYMPFSATATKQ